MSSETNSSSINVLICGIKGSGKTSLIDAIPGAINGFQHSRIILSCEIINENMFHGPFSNQFSRSFHVTRRMKYEGREDQSRPETRWINKQEHILTVYELATNGTITPQMGSMIDLVVYILDPTKLETTPSILNRLPKKEDPKYLEGSGGSKINLDQFVRRSIFFRNVSNQVTSIPRMETAQLISREKYSIIVRNFFTSLPKQIKNMTIGISKIDLFDSDTIKSPSTLEVLFGYEMKRSLEDMIGEEIHILKFSSRETSNVFTNESDGQHSINVQIPFLQLFENLERQRLTGRSVLSRYLNKNYIKEYTSYFE